MYTLVDPKSFWPQMSYSALPSNQIYMTPVPVTPTYLIGGTAPHVVPVANQTPGMYYNLQPNWYPQPQCVPARATSRPRTSSDDVFVFETPSAYAHTNAISIPNKNLLPKQRRQRVTGTIDDDMSLESNSPMKTSSSRRKCNSGTNSSDSSVSLSPQSDNDFGMSASTSARSSSPQCNDHSSIESMSHSSTYEGHKETTDLNFDNSMFNVFSASLYSALNRDPPEPPASSGNNHQVIPLKTSSPIPEEKRCTDQIMHRSNVVSGSENNNNIIKQIGSVASWSEHDCGSHDLGNDNVIDVGSGNRRQKFLRALQGEKERQRLLVLPKHAPKMNCKFCKNNGESPEVYTKHRLHFKEKTVCPLLRLYVCRLCNSTGDFAHTIRHCPFNSRFDKIAWKATFL